jgi:membrane protease YdiL (CAAX protease family)
VVCYIFAFLLGRVAIEMTVAMFVLVPAMLYSGTTDEGALMELVFSLPVLLTISVATLALILSLTYLFRRLLDRGTLPDLGLHRKPGWVSEIMGGLFLGTLLISLIFLLEWGAGWARVSGFAWQVQSPTLIVVNLLGYLVMIAAVAFHEELSFRGYILQNLNAEWGTSVALLASSVLFGLFHGANPNVSPIALLNICIAGVLLAVCYMATRGLWLPMAFHFSWDFVQGPLLSFPVSGLVTGGLLLTDIGGNPLLTGGAFGPEGGLVSTLAMSLGLLILLFWHKRQKRDLAE